jgi:hypothetical protein
MIGLISGFQTKGGGGADVGVGFTFVHETTDNLIDSPGSTVDEGGSRITLGGSHFGAAARGKSYVIFELIKSVLGFATRGVYPAGGKRVTVCVPIGTLKL